MTQERKYLDSRPGGGPICPDGAGCRHRYAPDEGRRTRRWRYTEALHEAIEAKDALEVALGALKALERLHRVERLEGRGEGR
jgi:hypothetical protein